MRAARSRKRQFGFTLLELLVVMAIIGTLVGLCAWILLIENLLQFVPGLARYTPGAAGLALAGKPDELPAAAGALMLILYALAASAGGWLATLRRDIA